MSFQKVIKLLRFYNQKSLLTPAVSLCRQELKYYSKTNCISSSETPVCVDNENADDEEEVEDLTKPLVKITVYFPKENVERQIEVRVGSTVFKSILKHDNTLMQSACNGQLTCRTCHCLVEEGFMHHFSEATDSEEDLLDAFANCQDNSRLVTELCRKSSQWYSKENWRIYAKDRGYILESIYAIRLMEICLTGKYFKVLQKDFQSSKRCLRWNTIYDGKSSQCLLDSALDRAYCIPCQMRVLQEFEGCRIEVVPEIKKDDDK